MEKTSVNKILPHPMLTVVLWLIWLLLNNTVAPGHMVLGLFLAVTIPLFTAGFWPEKLKIRAP
jgi:multicomponent K+:H+ antiporter subunit E